jgi:hypothetical protein
MPRPAGGFATLNLFTGIVNVNGKRQRTHTQVRESSTSRLMVPLDLCSLHLPALWCREARILRLQILVVVYKKFDEAQL